MMITMIKKDFLLCSIAIIFLTSSPLFCAYMSDMEKALFNQLGEDLKVSYMTSEKEGIRYYGTVDVEDISDELIDVFYGIIAQYDHEKNILNKNRPDWQDYNISDTTLHLDLFIDGKENRYLYGVIRVIRE